MRSLGAGRVADPERERLAAELRGQGLTFEEIGRRLGISRHHVSGLCRAPGDSVPPSPSSLGLLPGTTFALRLRTYRLLAGLTRGQLARRAGVSPAAVHAYELGDLAPRREHVSRLTEVLGPGLVAEPPARQNKAE
jgi:transcriptional regulator with XRE-family HTH domain